MSWKPLLDHPLFRIEARQVDTPRGPFGVVRMNTADWVNVVPVTAGGQVVLVRQYRFGVEASTLEVPGGVAEPGEEPAHAAARELREETGYGGGTWQALGYVHPNPAIQNNRTWLYVARGVELLGPPEPDPTESIEVELHPLGEVAHLLRSGAVTHALAVVTLQRLLLDPDGLQ